MLTAKKKHLMSAVGIQQLPTRLCKSIRNRFPKEAASHWMPSQHVWLDFSYEWSKRKADHPLKSEHLPSVIWEAGNTTKKNKHRKSNTLSYLDYQHQKIFEKIVNLIINLLWALSLLWYASTAARPTLCQGASSETKIYIYLFLFSNI